MARGRILALTAVLALVVAAAAVAGDGRMDANKDLILHVFFPHQKSSADIQNTWIPYVRNASSGWYNGTEGHSYFKKVYVYNGAAVGKNKYDVYLSTTPPLAGAPNNSWSSGRLGSGQIYIKESQAVPFVLVHELGHNALDLDDEYGGKLRLPGGAEIALPKYRGSTDYTAARSNNYRDYMWTGDFLSFIGATGAPGATSADEIFYCASPANAPRATCIMDGARWAETEFCCAGDHTSWHTVKLQLPELRHWEFNIWRWRWEWRTYRAADTQVRNYEVRVLQTDPCWVKAAQKLGVTAPASTSVQTGAPDPEIVLINRPSTVICIDRSGSMSDESRLERAKQAAKIFVNLSRVHDDPLMGDWLGLTSFDDVAAVDFSLREMLDDSTRQGLRAAVDALVTGDMTSIGGGLRVSLNEQLGQADPDAAAKSVILLSDGQHNAGEHPDSVLPDLTANDVTVHTIAVGSGADRDLLSRIARETGGEHVYLDYVPSLFLWFLQFFTEVTGSALTDIYSCSLEPGDTENTTVPVDSITENVTFAMVSENPSVEFTLRTPSGATINPSNLPSNVSYSSASDHKMYRVSDPAAGDWKLVTSRPGASGDSGSAAKDENPDLPITDYSTTTSTLQVSRTHTISNLTVTVDIQHTYIGDLEIDITSPGGTTVRLHDGDGGSTDNIIGTYGEALTSAEDLGAFFGETVNGTWTLSVYDHAGADTGALRSWGIAWGGAGSPLPVLVNLWSVAEDSVAHVDAWLDETDVTYPDAVVVHCLAAAEWPVIDATVQAKVLHPDGGGSMLTLYDDGDAEHADERADDGVYSATFDNYTGDGGYTFQVRADTSGGTLGIGGDPAPSIRRTVSLMAQVAGAPAVDDEWLRIDRLITRFNYRQPSMDSFVMSGQFNLMPAAFDPAFEDVRLGLGDWYSQTSDWQKVGRRDRYVYRTPEFTGQIDYWLGGSSRCRFKFAARKTMLQGMFPTLPVAPVDLELGWEFDESIDLILDSRGNTLRLGAAPTEPIFYVDTLTVRRNLRKPNRDSLVCAGRIYLPASFDPMVHGIVADIGPFHFDIPPGTLAPPVRGTKMTYRAGLPYGGKLLVTTDSATGKVMVRATRIDMSLISNPTTVRLALEGLSGAAWNYRLQLRENGPGTVLRY